MIIHPKWNLIAFYIGFVLVFFDIKLYQHTKLIMDVLVMVLNYHIYIRNSKLLGEVNESTK